MTQLVERWRRACRGAGATADDPDLDAAARQLLQRWAEPHRHYHDREHLTSVLAVIDQEDGDDLVRLAGWWHDASYDPRASGDANERHSAALAGSALAGLGVPASAAAEVARLVLVTAEHTPAAGDQRAELLCDADLAVLARPPHEYDRYAAAIRQEYRHVPEAAFLIGRAAVLRHLLDLPALYRRPGLAARWEAPARENLRRELTGLAVT